jgi:hypothetical protein
MSNLRLLPILLTIGLSILTIGCQSDELDPNESIVPGSSTNQPATNLTPDANSPAATRNGTNGTNATGATPKPEEDEFADGNYGEVDKDNIYRPRKREFEIMLPEKYDIQPQRDGVAFISDDGSFGGEVVFFEEDKPLDADDLENALKKIYNDLLEGASWQLSEIQPDGSVRLDWRGTTPEGQELDAVSYIEQRNDTVFILNVYGIDRPYDAFLDDSQTIIGSYLTWPDDDGNSDTVDELDPADDGVDNTDDATLDDATNTDENTDENTGDATLDDTGEEDEGDNRVGAP